MPFHFDYEESFPSTDFNKINLDWILQLATQLKETAESGGFDGAPGEPGTATNGIAYFTTADTFADIQAAISNGELPVLKYYIMGTPAYFYCYDHSNVWVDFIGFYGLVEYQLRWSSNGNRSLSSWSLASLQSPAFTGNPTVPTQEPTNSSTRIANTAFVQNAVSVAVQNAIEQFAIAPFTESFKQALLQLARKVAYIDGQGQTYYDALYNALYPPINVDHITAVWNPPQDYVVYTTTPVDSLKAYLTVTATYDDQSTAVLDDNDYVLSGVLVAGTSVITVTYAGATTTFNVTVVANVVESISATFTQGSAVIYETDLLSALVPYLTVTSTYTNLNTVYVDYPDYTLSGTLTEGTSTITVSYEGKTDTFNVTVTGYTWLYKASNGETLGAQSYVTKSTTGVGGTETVTNSILELSCNPGTGSQSNVIRFDLSDTTTTNAKLRLKAHFVNLPNSGNGCGFRLQLSGGSSGAQAYFTRNSSNKLCVEYYTGSTLHTLTTDFATADFHEIDLRLSGGHQILFINGVQIFDTATLSTNYCSQNSIINQAVQSTKNPNGVTTEIEWIGYIEVT